VRFAESVNQERVWALGEQGELDDSKIVDAVLGERRVFRRRLDPDTEYGSPFVIPSGGQGRKVVSFLFDVSASMYRFNGVDSRLLRACECAVMIMEAAQDLGDHLCFEIAGHNGDAPCVEFSDFAAPPLNEKDRFKIVQRMIASAQYCGSGDTSLQAVRAAGDRVAQECTGPDDEGLVLAFSDANFSRYRITADQLNACLAPGGAGSSTAKAVRTTLVLIGSRDAATALAAEVPAAVVAFDTKDLPRIVKEFLNSVGGGSRASL
jgi:hypothetical protein